MHIKNLEGVGIEVIVTCLLKAFSDYFVKMPPEVAYWEKRFKGAGVDWNASFGIFDNNNLVAFIINGIDIHQGQLTAFNTGTGVLPEYRSRKAVDTLYEFAIPYFRETGIEKCMLEVIQENFRAIRVYERIGFKITRRLKCFQGKIITGNEEYRIEEVPFEEVTRKKLPNGKFYSWDNSNAAVIRSGDIYHTYLVKDISNRDAGYFVINPDIGYVPQLEITGGPAGVVLNGLAEISAEVRLNNIDERRPDLIRILSNYGLVNTVNQYEMEMSL